ncbi:MAG: hypothetical protein AAGA48_08350 [Myxococcota bacterium]
MTMIALALAGMASASESTDISDCIVLINPGFDLTTLMNPDGDLEIHASSGGAGSGGGGLEPQFNNSAGPCPDTGRTEMTFSEPLQTGGSDTIEVCTRSCVTTYKPMYAMDEQGNWHYFCILETDTCSEWECGPVLTDSN